MSMKNSNDTIGNQTRNLPVCSAVPQPTAPPRAPLTASNVCKYKMKFALEQATKAQTDRVEVQLYSFLTLDAR